MKKIQLNSVEETKKIGYQIGKNVKSGTTIVLTGDLGTGKTTLTQGIGEGLGIKQLVKSPTYTIIREYDSGRLPLYHMDVYRLEGNVFDLGLDEYFEGDGVCIVEWGETILEDLPKDYIQLTLKRTYETDEKRELIISNNEDELLR